MNQKLEIQLKRISKNKNFRLNKGASTTVINHFEKKCKEIIPEEYKIFFSYINGGDMDGIEIACIHDPTESYQKETLYLEPLERSDFLAITDKRGLFIFGVETYGDLYVLEIKTGVIFWWDHEEDCLRKKWKSLNDFLKEKLDEIEEDTVELFF
ncbi:SMI1/KNR4 family protein [Bacillus vallismortis]|uniref:SMI1/KNR4 family protein n=1 Tax=Bacillus vallismortis TaxID=72361 RepID=UPI002DBBAC88|nr:SMI1/KNR4 family protein [Bacillus vallismortis]MEC1791042.1 SMI1/KNR4 family protein [Bacillus vallismortis]